MKTAVVAIVPKDSPIFPLGPVCVASHIAAHGYSVRGLIYDGQIMPDLRGYDVVMTGGLSSQYREVQKVMEAAAGKVTVIGGAIVTASPEVARTTPATYYVSGDGEGQAVRILEGTAEPDPWCVSGPLERNLDAYAPMNFGLFDFAGWLDKVDPLNTFLSIVENARPYPLHLARGCPFDCSFCWHDGQYRRRSIARVRDELEYAVRRYRVNLVHLIDDLLTDVPSVSRMMLEFGVKWTCQLRPGHHEDLNAMREAGCVAVSYGFESGSQFVLDSMRKRVRVQMLTDAAQRTRGARLGIIGNFIFGDSAETWTTALETIRLHRSMRWAGIFTGYVMPLPDSALWRFGHCLGRIGDRVRYLTRRPLPWVNLTRYGAIRFTAMRLLVWFHKITVPVYSPWFPVMHCPWCRCQVRHVRRPEWSGLTIAFCRECRHKIFAVRPWLFLALRAIQKVAGL